MPARGRYERAARELVQRERARMEADFDIELRTLRSQLEAEQQRTSVSAEMRLKHQDQQAKEELDELRTEAQEKIQQLEEVVEELEGTIASQTERMKEMEDEHEAACAKLHEESGLALRQMRAAQEETDLKREASRKLKEEIIDNDRLTVANLNRIKHLEAQVEQHKGALEEAEGENGELRAELAKALDHSEAAAEQGAELDALRELLAEREAQIVSLSRRLSDAAFAEPDDRRLSGGGGLPNRRESFLERFNLGGNNRSLLASGA